MSPVFGSHVCSLSLALRLRRICVLFVYLGTRLFALPVGPMVPVAYGRQDLGKDKDKDKDTDKRQGFAVYTCRLPSDCLPNCGVWWQFLE